ncbi:16354_t:CDS:1, partial [Gigaspora rosea]
TQGNVICPKLALQNFKYAGKMLCDAWNHDLIFGKHVNAKYVEKTINPFKDLQFESTEKKKIERQK